MKRVYILPNFFTTCNLFAGFYSIVSSIKGNYENAAWAILIAMFMDVLDGGIARITRATSHFGMEYDSIADVVSFGVAPGILSYLWMLKPMGRVGWLIAFLFLACGALRLARFNTMAMTSGKVKGFVGLPIPAAAGVVASLYLFYSGSFIVLSDIIWRVFISLLMVAVSFLMVSKVPYASLKGHTFTRRGSFGILTAFVFIIFIVSSYPRIFFFLGFMVYLISGIVIYLARKRSVGDFELERIKE